MVLDRICLGQAQTSLAFLSAFTIFVRFSTHKFMEQLEINKVEIRNLQRAAGATCTR